MFCIIVFSELAFFLFSYLSINDITTDFETVSYLYASWIACYIVL